MDNPKANEITVPLVPEEEQIQPDETASILSRKKEGNLNFRGRRHLVWEEIYALYRGTVFTNRLTQRQSVHLPLMKLSIKSALKDVDDPPLMFFDNLDNNEQAEIYFNEYWENCAEENKLVLKDIVDKKQVMLFGRTFKKLNIVNGKVIFTIEDPQDVSVDRYTDPTDIDTTRVLIHEHIYRALSSLEINDKYNQDAVAELKRYTASQQGLIKIEENLTAFRDKNQRLKDLGVPDVDNPMLGETYIELNEFYYKKFDYKLNKEVYWYALVAENLRTLIEKPLEEMLGKTSDHFWQNHLPYDSWADDVERTDFWSDAMGDILLNPNKVMDSWWSQEVENRTLRNYSMRFYNSSTPDFIPQTFEPVPWGFYPVPGNPNEIMQEVTIPDLGDTTNLINFIGNFASNAVATTPTQEGAIDPNKVTAFEIRLAYQEAKARVESMAIFYTLSWENFGQKFIKLIEANADKLEPITVYKKGYKGTMFKADISPKDWKTPSGFKVRVVPKTKKQQEDAKQIQNLQQTLIVMPDNVPLKRIYQEKLLDFDELNPDQKKEVLDFEEKRQKALENAIANPTVGGMSNGMGGNPVNPSPGQPTPPVATG